MEQTGIFENIFNTLAENAQDTSLLMIDAAYLKAHGSAAILRKNSPRCIGRTKGGLNSKLHAIRMPSGV